MQHFSILCRRIEDITVFVHAITLLRTTATIIIYSSLLLLYCGEYFLATMYYYIIVIMYIIYIIYAHSAPRSCTTGVRVCDRVILVAVKNDRVGINILCVIIHAYTTRTYIIVVIIIISIIIQVRGWWRVDDWVLSQKSKYLSNVYTQWRGNVKYFVGKFIFPTRPTIYRLLTSGQDLSFKLSILIRMKSVSNYDFRPNPVNSPTCTH